MNLLARYRLARDRSVTVANLIDELVRRKGDCAVAVHEGRTFHLSELHAEICAMDMFLRRVVGLRPGQLVAIYRSNTRTCFHWFLAIIRAGGIAVPLNPQLSLGEVHRILRESGAEVLVTDRAVYERTIGHRQALPVRTWIQAEDGDAADGNETDEKQMLDGFLRVGLDVDQVSLPSGPPEPPTTLDPTATVAIFHTSGTSGFPKGAALSSDALLGARASTVLCGIFLGPRDLALVALPWSHIMAVSIALYGLMAGIRGCFLNRFQVGAALDLIERLHVTAVVGVPTMFARLVNSQADPARLRSVRVWLSASDYLPSEVRQRLRPFGALFRLPGGLRVPPILLNGYGMVELGGLAMMGIEWSFLPGSGDLCFPIPPFRIRLVNDRGETVPVGVTGECQIRRRGLTPHYWREHADPEGLPTREGGLLAGEDGLLTREGWLRTGDLAVRNRLGLIRIVGRSKEVIKSGGYSVYVRELEEALLAHSAVARAVAFGLPHPEKGETPVAAVELLPDVSAHAFAHGDASIQEIALLDWCRSRLAAYKTPRQIWILSPGELPQNANGKYIRRELQQRFATTRTRDSGF